MLRFEVEHIAGQKEYSANAAYIGVRFNFWLIFVGAIAQSNDRADNVILTFKRR
jgi:hypothetical protein